MEPDPGPFSEGEKGFHELAAGLFMVGYDLPVDLGNASLDAGAD